LNQKKTSRERRANYDYFLRSSQFVELNFRKSPSSLWEKWGGIWWWRESYTKGLSFTKEFEKGFNATEKTLWETLDNKPCKIKGRVIGGCFDTLTHLIGTPYGNLDNFKKLAEDDGVVFYFENAESNPCNIARILWSMKLEGWFEKANGVVLGRSAAEAVTNENNLNYVELITEIFKELNLPLIYDADIGHQ